MGKMDQAVCGRVVGIVGKGVVCHVDADGRAPLFKPGSAGVVDNALVVEAVKAATAPGLTLVASHNRLEARVDV